MNSRVIRLIAAIGAMALPFTLATPAIAAPDIGFGGASVTDAAGYGDGNLHPGRSASLLVTIFNNETHTVTNVNGTLSTTTAGITVTDPGPKAYPDLPASDGGPHGGTQNEEPFTVAVASGVPCPSGAAFSISLETDDGPVSLPFTIDVGCNSAVVSTEDVVVRDAATGDVVDAVSIGPTFRLELNLRNVGTADASDVTGHLISSGDARIDDADHDFGSIPIAGTSPGVYTFALTHCGDGLAFELKIGGADTIDGANIPIRVETRCPGIHPIFTGITFDDSESGNGDGFPQPGETVSITISFRNDGSEALTGIRGVLDLGDADVLQNSSTFPDAGPGERVVSEATYLVKIHEDAPSTQLDDNRCGIPMVDGFLNVTAPTEIATLRGRLHLTMNEGEADLEIGTVAVCALAVEQNRGTPLAETGAGHAAAVVAGVGFVLVGVALRRRYRTVA